MVYVILKKNMADYEADVRDLVMAFYPYQDYKFVVVEDPLSFDMVYTRFDTVISDFYDGKIYESRFETKNHIKRALYDYLHKKLKVTLPWGTLTGIRPVNILTEGVGDNISRIDANDFIDKKSDTYDKKKVSDYLKKEYYVSDEKINELIDIADNERVVLKREELSNYKKRCSVYIGIPFCKTTCLYCSFTSYSIDRYKDIVDDYLLSLDNEIKENIEKDKMKGAKKEGIDTPLTLYVGGGTPTSLSEQQFEKFLSIVDKHFHTKDKKIYMEYTIEAGRPDTITEKKLRLMKEYGVSRISINPQTFNQKTLDLIGRKHTVDDVIQKYKMALDLGLDNINMDIILGLPKENLDDVVNTLIKLGNLNPSNITVHSLAIKRAARLNYELASWIDNLENEDINNMFYCSKYLTDLLSMKPYYLYRQKNMSSNLENIGYAKEGKECIYNIMMMGEKHTVYGFGCGGVGKKVEYKDKEKIVTRLKGTKSLPDYINKYK